MNNSKFMELSNQEIMEVEGGIVIAGVTIAGLTLLKFAGASAALGLTLGVTIGLNKKNRTSKKKK